MPHDLRIALGLVIASVVAYLATPVAVRLAKRLEFYDVPTGGYKIHASPTPYLGGAAILVALLTVAPLLAVGDSRLPLLLGGGLVLWLTGTIDDRRPLSPLLRLAIEAGVAMALFAGGEHWELGLGGVVDALVTVAWIVGVVNAFNLIDNMDGVATVLALAASATVAVLASIQGDLWLTVAAVAMSGACLGFLPHNVVRPARIFLGDGGSMLLGFGTAALTLMLSSDAPSATQSLVIGLMVVALPVADMLVRIVSRRRRGISPLVGGRDSITHHARALLPTAWAVAFALGGLQALIAAMTIAASGSGSGAWSASALVVVFLALLGAGIVFLRGEAPQTADARAQLAWREIALRSPVLASALVLALLVALAPFAGGYYDSRIWVPAGLAVTGLLVAALVARPAHLGRVAATALAALAGLALWALLSSTWAGASEQAIVGANRYAMYAVLLALLLVLARVRAALWQGTFLAVAVAAVALVLVVQIAAAHGSGLFLGGRLNEPLGYINGLGSFFLVGFWLLVALVEQRRSAVGAGLAMAGAFLTVALMLLSQSRGVAFGLAASVVIVLLVVPGRVRRALALLVLAAGATAITSSADALYQSGLNGAVQGDLATTFGVRVLIVAGVVGVLWGVAVAGPGRVVHPALRRAAITALCGLAVLVVGIGALRATTISRAVDRQYQAFVALSPAQGGEQTASRLLSGVGYRYDYWRVAVRTFRRHEIAGVGAGNYPAGYFRERSTAENIRQPHSLGLQTLAELGLVGGLLLLVLLGAVVLGAVRVARRAAGDLGARQLAVAAIGAGGAWLVHTNVDWIHLLPGVTLIALWGASVLVHGADVHRGAQRSPRPRALTAGIVVAVMCTLALASLTLARQMISERYQRHARDVLAASPQESLRYAERALQLDPQMVSANYIKAAALARFGDAAASEKALRAGLRSDPANFVTLALLGDLAVRRGDLPQAGRWYRAAHATNPLDPTLRQLARDQRGTP